MKKKNTSYQARRTHIKRKEAIKKGRKTPFLNLKSQGVRDAISDYRKGARDPDLPMKQYEDHTYSIAYRETMRKLIQRPAKAKKNPAPSPASRSGKFHRMRAALLTALQIARRKGSFVQEYSISHKLLKLDRMFYAPRNVKRKLSPGKK